MNPLKVISSLAAMLVLSSALPAHAYKVAPLVMELEPTGQQSQTTVTVTNTHAYPLTLEFTPTKRHVAEDGTETETPADDDFLIFPPQAIVPPGKAQKLRVKYVGETPEMSEAYRLTVNQIPVKRKPTDPAVTLNFKFRTAIYVVPDDVSFDLKTESLRRDGDHYRVRISNSGSRHAVATSGDWLATSSTGKTKTYTGNELGIGELSLIAPNSEREFLLPAEILSELGDLKSIEARPVR